MIYINIKYILQNSKPDSMKENCKFFFYLYSKFHVFTRQSSVENCY